MSEPTAFSFRANEVLKITFPSFAMSITFHEGRRLTVIVLEGDNAGFTDTIDYHAITVRDGIVVLSWQKHIGSTIVHVLDLANADAHTFVTPAQGGFSRMSGKVHASGPKET
jgi:hypothetical protein